MLRFKIHINLFYILLILIFFVNGDAFAQKAGDSLLIDSIQDAFIQTDSSHLKVEAIPWNKITDFRNNSDFNYTYKPKIRFDFLSRFLYWLEEILNAIFSKQGVAPYLRLLFVMGILALLVYLVLKSDLSGIFSKNRKSKNGNEFDYFDEDIHNQDLDEKLKQAVVEKNYRKAIRYNYLILLKSLDLSELIQWTLSKTNQDYLEELNNHPILDNFRILSGIYEYTWYGSFSVGEEHYSEWQSDFKTAINQINQNKKN